MNIECDFIFGPWKTCNIDLIINDFVRAGAYHLKDTGTDAVQFIYSRGAAEEDENTHSQKHRHTFIITVEHAPKRQERASLSCPTWKPERTREYLIDVLDLASKVDAKIFDRQLARYIEIDNIDEIISLHRMNTERSSGKWRVNRQDILSPAEKSRRNLKIYLGQIKPEQLYELSIEHLEFSVRTLKCLKEIGVFYIGEIMQERYFELIMEGLDAACMKEIETKLTLLKIEIARLPENWLPAKRYH